MDNKKIAALLRQLANEFDGANSNTQEPARATLKGVAKDDARVYSTKTGKHITRLRIDLDEPRGNMSWVSCIAWTNKLSYQFRQGEQVEFTGYFQPNDRGFREFVIDKNLKPHTSDSAASNSNNSQPKDDDDVPF